MLTRALRSRARRRPSDQRTRVLCLHTATLPPLGADTWVHAEIIKAIDTSVIDVRVAYVFTRDGEPTPTARSLEPATGATHLDVNLGRERFDRATVGRLADARDALTALRSIVRLARYVWRERIDIIHTSDRPRDAVTAVFLARISRARSAVHLHVLYSAWMSTMLRWAIRHADARIAVSEFVAESIPTTGVKGPTYVVLNAIQPDHWHPGEGRTAARDELGIPVAATVVITVCRLFEEKGVARLIEAFAAARDAVADARLLIVGHDPSGGDYLEQLRSIVARSGTESVVTFTGRRPDVARLLAAADVFAMPSFEEPFGLVFAEAMAMQLPVVALDNGGTREVLVHGEHGLLSAPDDHDELVRNLRTLLADADRRTELGLAGRRHVEQHFRVDRMAADAAGAYRLIASQRT